MASLEIPVEIGAYKLAEDMATPVPCSLAEWGVFRRNPDNVVVCYDSVILANGEIVEVSTVFIGIDISLGYSTSPALWETMIFGGIILDGQEQWWHTSRADAESVHRDVARRVREQLTSEPVAETAPPTIPAPVVIPETQKRRINLDEG